MRKQTLEDDGLQTQEYLGPFSSDVSETLQLGSDQILQTRRQRAIKKDFRAAGLDWHNCG